MIFSITDSIVAQNLLNLPESVVYDSLRSRYIVSNWGTGHLVQIDSNEIQTYLITNQQCFAGLHLEGDILYVACREYGVKGFDLSTNLKILDVQIPGATNINDITADTSGNLYVSCPTCNQIFKIKISSQTYSTFVDSGVTTPNGLYFDEHNNRLLIISYRFSSPVQAINLVDSTLSTVTTTTLNNLDGLTRDNENNYYVSSWYNNAVYRFDSTFSNPPELFSTHSDDPADIYFNKYDNILAVPLFFTHDVEFVSVPTLINEKANSEIVDKFILFQNYPNPFNPKTTIKYYLQHDTNVALKIYNVLGKEVRTLFNENQSGGSKSVIWDGTDNSGEIVSSGVYIYRLLVNKSYMSAQNRKMIFLK